MKDVLVKVRCAIEWSGGEIESTMQTKINEAVRGAIEDALYRSEASGFNHNMPDVMSIVVTDVDAQAIEWENTACPTSTGSCRAAEKK